jgi:hypothetical protein
LLEKGALQSNRICVDVIGNNNTKYVSEAVQKVFEQKFDLKEVLLFNGSKIVTVHRQHTLSKTFEHDFRKLWERAK